MSRAGACLELLSKQQAVPCGGGRKQVTDDRRRGCALGLCAERGPGPLEFLGCTEGSGACRGGGPCAWGPPATGGLCSACPGPSFHCSEGRGGAASGPGLQRARVCGLRSGPAPSDVLVLIMWPFASQAIGVAITSWSEM